MEERGWWLWGCWLGWEPTDPGQALSQQRACWHPVLPTLLRPPPASPPSSPLPHPPLTCWSSTSSACQDALTVLVSPVHTVALSLF